MAIPQCPRNSHVKAVVELCILITTKGYTVMNTGLKIDLRAKKSGRQNKKNDRGHGCGVESLRAVFEVVFPPHSLIYGTRLQQRLEPHTHVLANAQR
jgi:hypothetical protein